MKKKTVILILVIVIILLLGAIMVPQISRSLRIKSCVENGGVWNYQCGLCDTIYSSEKEIIDPQIEFIQVFFYHSFLYPSVIAYNIHDGTILFQHNGTSLLMITLPKNPDEETSYEVVEMYKPSNLYFRLNTERQSYLIDSIFCEFKEIDFQDNIDNGYDDGGGHMLLFGYNNDSIKQVQLLNACTEYQHKLILFLVDECVKQESDSLTNNYLRTLKRYTD